MPLALLVLGLTCGYHSGASAAPIAATIVPLLFGLLTVFAIAKQPQWSHAIAILVFCVAFRVGFDFGENIDRPRDLHQIVTDTGVNVTEEERAELYMLQLALRQKMKSGRLHDTFLHFCIDRVLRGDRENGVERLRDIKDWVTELDRPD